MPLVKSFLPVLIACAALAGCATDAHRAVSPGMATGEVSARIGEPSATGRLPNGDTYWDHSDQPRGYSIDRVTFAANGLVREVRNLLTEQNFVNIRSGMAPHEVAAIVGPSSAKQTYGNGTSSWSYRYFVGVVKLLHVVFDPKDRVLSHYSEWDPDVYSRIGSSDRSRGGKGR